MNIFTLLLREAHFQVNLYKTHHARTTFGSWHVEKVHAVVARSTCGSQIVQSTPGSDHFWKLTCRKSASRCGAKRFQVKMRKAPQCRTAFGSYDVQKVHAIVVRSTFGSQHAQKTPCSDHFWKLRCRKKRTPLWCEADFEIKSVNVVLDGRRKGVCTLSKNEQKSEGFVHHSTLHDYNYLLTVASGKWFLQESLPIPNFLKCFQKLLFFQEISSFWFLGNAKNPTDLGLVFDIPKLDYITVQHTTLH